MNDMYNMGLSIHSVGSGVLMATILLNMFILNNAQDIKKYKRVVALYLSPLSITVVGGVLFSGTIMMAAKHLNFTLENIVMIVISVLLIVFEAKRLKRVKFVNPKQEGAMVFYREYASKILWIELALVLVISLWMWSIS